MSDKSKKAIKALMDTDYKDSDAHFKMVQLLKGLASSKDDQVAKMFLDGVSDALTTVGKTALKSMEKEESVQRSQSPVASLIEASLNSPLHQFDRGGREALHESAQKKTELIETMFSSQWEDTPGSKPISEQDWDSPEFTEAVDELQRHVKGLVRWLSANSKHGKWTAGAVNPSWHERGKGAGVTLAPQHERKIRITINVAGGKYWMYVNLPRQVYPGWRPDKVVQRGRVSELSNPSKVFGDAREPLSLLLHESEDDGLFLREASSLKECRNCGALVASEKKRCPQCGEPFDSSKERPKFGDRPDGTKTAKESVEPHQRIIAESLQSPLGRKLQEAKGGQFTDLVVATQKLFDHHGYHTVSGNELPGLKDALEVFTRGGYGFGVKDSPSVIVKFSPAGDDLIRVTIRGDGRRLKRWTEPADAFPKAVAENVWKVISKMS